MDKDKKIVSEEVDDRLDAFFSDDDWAPAPEPPPKQAAPLKQAPVAATPDDEEDVITLEAAAPDSPAVEADKLGLGDLKVLILSLDWEITDAIMEKMEDAARSLKARYSSDAVATTHLSLMELLGKYIRVKKADAHPDSVLLLREVYDGLENCLSRPGDETARKRAALVLVERFNRIKKQIAAVKGVKPRAAEIVDEGEIIEARVAAGEEEDVITAQPVAMAPSAVNLAAVKDEIVAALKSHLDAELSSIRAEIREAREAVDRAVSQILAAVSALGGKNPPENDSGEILASTALAGDVLDAEPLEAAIVEDSGEDDVIDSEPLEASAVQPRELPGSGDLAAEGDLALELGLSIEDDLGPGPDPKDDLELL